MIVREPLAGDFTVVPNELLRDTALSFDAKAVMAWLLSLPRDWTVRLEQVRQHWGCNLARMKKVMRELIEAGWVQRRPPRRQPDGTFGGGDYVVFNVRQPVQADLPLDVDDTPAPESEIQTPAARNASPEFAEPESGKRTPYKEQTLPNNPPYPPEGGARPSEIDVPENRGRDERQSQQHPERQPWRSQGCRGAEPPAVPPETAARFERLRAAYPLNGRLGANGPRALAFFAALSSAEQEAAITAAGVVARTRAETRGQVHNLDRWLDPNRASGGLWRNAVATIPAAAGAGGPPPRVFVRDGSPEWDAWAARYRRDGKPMPTPIWSAANRADGWNFPAALPPATEKAA